MMALVTYVVIFLLQILVICCEAWTFHDCRIFYIENVVYFTVIFAK